MIRELVCLSEANFKYSRNILYQNEEQGRIENEWQSFSQLCDIGQGFYKLKTELHVENGLFLLNHKFVIPEKLRENIIKWPYGLHLGIETLAIAKILYYWYKNEGSYSEL